jgi:hypothetical protein
MKNNYAPIKERGNCVAGTRNSTANNKITQSRADQRARILKWLQAHNRITTLEARNTLGIMHPASRIQELRKAGHDIVTYLQWDTDATGKQHKQGLYILLGGDV